MSQPEPALSAEEIVRGLDTLILGRRVICRDQVGSTNDIAKELAQAGALEGTVVLAEEQTAGRGRLGRSWSAPAHSSILMSLVLRPALEPAQLPRVAMAVTLGACDAIQAETGLRTRIKWPNDILLNGKKCAGILAEANIVGDQVEYVIFGLGLNVNFSAAILKDVAEGATTIADECGRRIPRLALVRALLRQIEHYYSQLGTGPSLHDEWAARLSTLGRPVRAQTPWGEEQGYAEAVDEDGALIVRRNDNSIVRLVAGSVSLSPH